MVNSFFENDSKYHLSINKETGLWQDFKSGEKGNFIHLVSIVENIGYKLAEQYIVRKILKDPFLLLDIKKKTNEIRVQQNVTTKSLNHYYGDFLKLKYEMLNWGNPIYEKAIKEIESRKISLNKVVFYAAHSGRFVNRLIVPYERKGQLFYFQGRALSLYAKPKYLNPSSEEGVRASDILYPFNTYKSYVILTEGVFDAISLQLHGLNATSIGGAILSQIQAEKIKHKKVILALDSDKAGIEGAKKAKQLLANLGVNSMFCTPNKPYKDWNEMHVAGVNLMEYFKTNTNEFLKWHVLQSIQL